jgi:1,4-dihydroxy-2-naphthoate octaprenyltransferase
MILFGVAGAIGLYLAIVCGPVVLILGAVGAFSGFFYTAPPFRFVSRGIGEVFIGLNFGVLMTLGSFYVQYRELLVEPIVASLPVAILIVAVLYINQFPDVKADEAAGKRTSVVRLGLRNASKGYAILMVVLYVIILEGPLLGLLRPQVWMALGTVPFALIASRIALEKYADPKGLTPAYASTVLNHMITGLSLSVAYLFHGLGIWPFVTLASGVLVFMVSTVLATRLLSPIRAPQKAE